MLPTVLFQGSLAAGDHVVSSQNSCRLHLITLLIIFCSADTWALMDSWTQAHAERPAGYAALLAVELNCADRTVQYWRARRLPGAAAGCLMCPLANVSPLHCCREHGALACGCVASVRARNDRLRRASSPHLPPASGRWPVYISL